jgi:hypothetical protein
MLCCKSLQPLLYWVYPSLLESSGGRLPHQLFCLSGHMGHRCIGKIIWNQTAWRNPLQPFASKLALCGHQVKLLLFTEQW